MGPRVVVKCSVEKREGSQGMLSGESVEMIVLNVPSFAKGCDLWATSSDVGLLDADGQELPVNEQVELQNQVQSLGDGCLNILSYSNSIRFRFRCGFPSISRQLPFDFASAVLRVALISVRFRFGFPSIPLRISLRFRFGFSGPPAVSYR